MNGKVLWAAVRREFKDQYPTGTIHRVENTLERGMPDVVWCANGESGWIELKGVRDQETPLQCVFRRKWHKAGGKAVLLINNKEYGFGVMAEGDYWDWFDTLAEATMCIVGG